MTTKALLRKFSLQSLIELLRQFKVSILDGYAVKSYAQEGEDMVLRRIFEGVEQGFYVDIGAHHPKRFSNTYFFYKRGWSGINADAMPGSMTLFRKIRPRDINIEAAVGDGVSEKTFFMFDEPAFSSFDKALSSERAYRGHTIRAERKLVTKSLEEILRENVPEGTKINFMSIDVEGLDFEVLQSNNWKLFRPEFICVESVGATFADLAQNEIYRFLCECGYDLYAKTVHTLIFREISKST